MGLTKKQRATKDAAVKRSEAAKVGWATRRENAKEKTFSARTMAVSKDVFKMLKDHVQVQKVKIGEEQPKMGTLTSIAYDTNRAVIQIENRLSEVLYTLRNKFDRLPTTEDTGKAESSERFGIFSNFTRATIGLGNALELINQIDKLQEEVL